MNKKIFDDTTFFVDNRILIKLNKKDLKKVLSSPKDNHTKINYLIDVFMFYKDDLLEIFTKLETKEVDFSYLKFFFETYGNKETFSLLFERTTFKTLKLFIEKCLIPSDDFYEITISLKNELKDELSFLDDDEFDIVFRNEVINILKNYSFSI